MFTLYVYFFSASCTTVTCSFTIDNIVESVKYNEDALTITSDDLNNWKKLKTIEFESCYDSNPGKLEVKGSDLTEGKLCKQIPIHTTKTTQYIYLL